MTKRPHNPLLHPRVAIVLHDLVMVWAAWTAVRSLRYSFWPDSPPLEWFAAETAIVLVVQAVVLHVSGLYRGIWRFASLPDLWNIVRAAALGTLGISLALFLLNRLELVPRSAFVMYPLVLTALLGGPRLAWRLWKDHRLEFHARPGRSVRVLIIGAGRTGDRLARDLRAEGIYYPVGFLDDDEQLRGRKLRGLPVFGTVAELKRIVAEQDVAVVVIAIPTAHRDDMRRIVALCEGCSVEFRTVPPLRDLVSGQLGKNQLKAVAIEDLLGREPVNLDWAAIRAGVSGRAILVTGGGGSIGSELCRQLAGLAPARIGILEQSEYNLYEIERELRGRFPQLELHVALGDVCDAGTVRRFFERFDPHIVFHAAAYKQMPLLQGQLREAIRNNVVGTMTVARAARTAAIDRFVLISTDKAVNPVNVMGASKRIAELYCQLLASGPSPTRFLTVRFGNVLDSAGSVVPLFREQIAAGGPVTVTHPDVARFFMTIPEACLLILQAAALGESGEIYVLDMGDPVRIRDLADQMIRLAGKVPEAEIPIVYSGLRDGEKLVEELFHEQESLCETGHAKIWRARHRELDLARTTHSFVRLEHAVTSFDEAALEQVLDALLPEYAAPGSAVPAAAGTIVPLRARSALETR